MNAAVTAAPQGVDASRAVEMLSQMILVRRFEEKCAELYGAQKIRGFLHLYVGEEAVAVGAMRAFRSDDPVVTTYREHGHALVRGISPEAVMAEMYGKTNGCARGRGGSMHLFCVERRFYGGYAIVAGGIPVAVGLAFAEKQLGTGRVVGCFFGDGATDEGEFHEALNLAALWKLPVLFLCENNQYAMGTALARHCAARDLTRVPLAHGIPAEAVDGMDVLAVEAVTRAAVDVVRATGAPRFLELRTYRFRAHSMYDADRYREKDEIARWRLRDPIELFATFAKERGLIGDDDRARLEREADAKIDAAVAAAEAGPLEPVEDLESDVYARRRP